MKWPLSSLDTMLSLRVLVRNKNEPLPGRALRIGMNRRGRDGAFLDKLVAMGLVEVVTPGERRARKAVGTKDEPVQFRTTYRLTPMGEHAAEYGEYERPDPKPLPVRDARKPRVR